MLISLAAAWLGRCFTLSLICLPVRVLYGIGTLRLTLGLWPSHPCLVPTASAGLILSLNRDLLGSKVITQAMVTGD